MERFYHHVKSKDNISDLGTRNDVTIDDVSEDSAWQNGPAWMSLSKEEWPVNQDVGENQTRYVEM